MNKDSSVTSIIHDEIEHFQGLAFGGDRIAVLMAAHSYIRWTSHAIPHDENVAWLRQEFDDALEKYRTGQARTLGQAFGIKDRTHTKMTALQHKNSPIDYPFDSRKVGRFLHQHKELFEHDPASALERLGREVPRKRSNQKRPSSLRVEEAQQDGSAAYLLYHCHRFSRRGAAIHIYRELRTKQKFKKCLESAWGKSALDAMGAIVGVGGSSVRDWYFEYQKMDVYWSVLYKVLDDRLSWDDAYAEVAYSREKKVEQVRKWFKEGRALVMKPE